MRAIIAGFMDRKLREKKQMQIASVYAVEVLAKETEDKKIMTVLRRAHENLGHPSTGRFISLLKSAKTNEQTLKLARDFKCDTCSQKADPVSTPVSRVKRTWDFNKQILVDTFEVEVLNRKLKRLNVVDEGTACQICAPLWHGIGSKRIRTCYRKNWKRWAGVPARIFSDNGHEFEGEFVSRLEADGSFWDTTAAYSPHQNGMCERRGATWKRVFEKAVTSRRSC